jgi:pSer/pThr/pTyr-binding forkhead associated (FHA) protein
VSSSSDALFGTGSAALVGAPVLGLGSRVADHSPKTKCGRCGGVNPLEMAFCQFCGARLEAVVADASGRSSDVGGRRAADMQQPWHERSRQQPPERPAAASARLVVIAQDGTPGREYLLDGEQTDIGREEGSVLLPNDPYVSPRHARVTRRNGGFFVRDLGSVNGVYVRLRQAARLEHADLVLIGLEVLRFEVVSDAEKGLGPAAERGAHVFGSPPAPRYARLCQRTVEGVTRDVFYLTRDETVVGREAGDIVFTSDPFMSRRHAAITRDPRESRFSLRDLGSSNGTYLAIRGEIELENGDHIRIGQHLFRLDVDPSGRI